LTHKLFQTSERSNCCALKSLRELLNFHEFHSFAPGIHSLHPVEMLRLLERHATSSAKRSFQKVGLLREYGRFLFLIKNRVSSISAPRAPAPRHCGSNGSEEADRSYVITAKSITSYKNDNLHAWVELINKLVLIYLNTTRNFNTSNSPCDFLKFVERI
jgi:hypothetical protein